MIVWLLARTSDVPVDDSWLLATEQATLAGLTRPKRRLDWRLGRWAAKRATGSVLGVPPAGVEICTESNGAPSARCAGIASAARISISHRAGLGLCVVAVPPVAIGCDVEIIERRAAVFEEDWFTEAERRLVVTAPPGDHDRLVTLIWSAKESALKALGSGLRRDTRSVVVDAIGAAAVDGWRTLSMSDAFGADLKGWWRQDDGFVLSVVGPSMPLPPSVAVPS